MQEPPPIKTLLSSLQTFSDQVQLALREPDIDWLGESQSNEWSLTEVLCHLRDVEREVHQTRVKALIEEDGAFLPGAVADAWVIEREYYRQDGPTALRDFVDARADTLRNLRALDDHLFKRQGQHAFFGPTTLHELVYLMVQHDEAHMEQILKLLKQEGGDLNPDED